MTQVEVDSADKVSFDRALRSVLRHDPDIVMIGEIRDRETAGVAIKAALTGHLVFSTLHTNGGQRRHALARYGRGALPDRGHVAAGGSPAVGAAALQALPEAAPLKEAEAAALHARTRPAARSTSPADACIAPIAATWAGWRSSSCCRRMRILSREIAEGCDEAQILERMRQAKIPR